MGYECYVNDDAKIVHYEGMSGKSLSYIQTATKPAARRGSIIFSLRWKTFVSFLDKGVVHLSYIDELCCSLLHRDDIQTSQ